MASACSSLGSAYSAPLQFSSGKSRWASSLLQCLNFPTGDSLINCPAQPRKFWPFLMLPCLLCHPRAASQPQHLIFIMSSKHWFLCPLVFIGDVRTASHSLKLWGEGKSCLSPFLLQGERKTQFTDNSLKKDSWYKPLQIPVYFSPPFTQTGREWWVNSGRTSFPFLVGLAEIFHHLVLWDRPFTISLQRFQVSRKVGFNIFLHCKHGAGTWMRHVSLLGHAI